MLEFNESFIFIMSTSLVSIQSKFRIRKTKKTIKPEDELTTQPVVGDFYELPTKTAQTAAKKKAQLKNEAKRLIRVNYPCIDYLFN